MNTPSGPRRLPDPFSPDDEAGSAPADERILVVGPAWVGDMVMSQTLYRYLHKRYPDQPIDVLAPPATVSLVARMPEVSMGIHFKQEHGEFGFGYRKGLGEKLTTRGYRRAFVLPNSWKSALVPFFANVPVRTGFRGEYRFFLLNDIRLLNPARLPRMIDRFLALAVEPGAELPDPMLPRLVVDEANLLQVSARLGLGSARPVLGLCPGAEFGDAKRWPEAHFAAVADAAIERGMQVWLFGGPGDAATGRAITGLMKSADHCVDLTGQTSLVDAIDLLSQCCLVISNDSGLMHVAAAVGVNVAVLYGSTSPDFTPPLSEHATVLSESLDCSPCFKRTCPLGHKNCLNKLAPERLIPLVEQSLPSS